MNDHEADVREVLTRRGYEVFSRGWPDFLISRRLNGHELFAGVEVKSERDFVSDEQLRMHALLESFGLPVNVMVGDDLYRRLRHARVARVAEGTSIQLCEWRLGDRTPRA